MVGADRWDLFCHADAK